MTRLVIASTSTSHDYPLLTSPYPPTSLTYLLAGEWFHCLAPCVMEGSQRGRFGTTQGAWYQCQPSFGKSKWLWVDSIVFSPILRFSCIYQQGRGYTALMRASDSNHIEIVSALLTVPGINPNHANVSIIVGTIDI